MASDVFDCGGYYKNYDMTGEIHIGTGIVKVHDLFNPLPDFMKQADVILSDPPYNQSALSSFYTKAEINEKQKFDDFFVRYMEIVREINPRIVILEVGKKQTDMWKNALTEIYSEVRVFEAKYYDKLTCMIIVATSETIPECLISIPNVNEEKIIDMICRDLDFQCVCDPCMGTGLVGWYANKYGKKFVGTELNKKRLARLIEGITTGKKKSK